MDLVWSEGRLETARIRSDAGKFCRIRTDIPAAVTSAGLKVKVYRPEEAIVEFRTKPGETYVVRPERGR